jgi:hypothetical protein
MSTTQNLRTLIGSTTLIYHTRKLIFGIKLQWVLITVQDRCRFYGWLVGCVLEILVATYKCKNFLYIDPTRIFYFCET